MDTKKKALKVLNDKSVVAVVVVYMEGGNPSNIERNVKKRSKNSTGGGKKRMIERC